MELELEDERRYGHPLRCHLGVNPLIAGIRKVCLTSERKLDARPQLISQIYERAVYLTTSSWFSLLAPRKKKLSGDSAQAGTVKPTCPPGKR